MGTSDESRDRVFDALLATIRRQPNKPKLRRLLAGKFEAASLEQWHLVEHKRFSLGYINRFRQLAPGNVIPEVYFAYVDSPEINAFAITPRIHDPYIAFNVGTIFLVVDFFHRALSRPDTFVKLGNPGAEKLRNCHKEALHRNYDDPLAVRPGGIAESRPHDFARDQFAGVMAANAFMFLMLHEMVHIRNGHCEYGRRECQKKNGNWDHRRPFFFEAASAISDQEIGLARQAMEFEADGTAAVTGFSHYFRTKPGLPRPDQQLIFEWVFSVAALVYLLGCRFSPARLLIQHHPPSSMRMSLMGGAIEQHLRESGSDEKAVDEFREIYHRATADAKGVLGICGADINAEIRSAGLDAAAIAAHQNLIIRKWHEIRPSYQPFGYR